MECPIVFVGPFNDSSSFNSEVSSIKYRYMYSFFFTSGKVGFEPKVPGSGWDWVCNFGPMKTSSPKPCPLIRTPRLSPPAQHHPITINHWRVSSWGCRGVKITGSPLVKSNRGCRLSLNTRNTRGWMTGQTQRLYINTTAGHGAVIPAGQARSEVKYKLTAYSYSNRLDKMLKKFWKKCKIVQRKPLNSHSVVWLKTNPKVNRDCTGNHSPSCYWVL